MNVKQLKEYLSNLPDDMEVTIGDGHGWLYEIGSVHLTPTKEKGKKKSTSYSADDKIRESERMTSDIRVIKEIEVKVIPYKIKAKCSSCKTGEYLPTGKVYPTNPPLYEHECTDCKENTKVRGKQYPEIIWKELEE